jgi:hypothetical protein
LTFSLPRLSSLFQPKGWLIELSVRCSLASLTLRGFASLRLFFRFASLRFGFASLRFGFASLILGCLVSLRFANPFFVCQIGKTYLN